MVARWHRSSLLYGYVSLSEKKGKTKKMVKPNKKQKTKSSHEKELNHKIELLKIENTYLKKLQTFQQNIMTNPNQNSYRTD